VARMGESTKTSPGAAACQAGFLARRSKRRSPSSGSNRRSQWVWQVRGLGPSPAPAQLRIALPAYGDPAAPRRTGEARAPIARERRGSDCHARRGSLPPQRGSVRSAEPRIWRSSMAALSAMPARKIWSILLRFTDIQTIVGRPAYGPRLQPDPGHPAGRSVLSKRAPPSTTALSFPEFPAAGHVSTHLLPSGPGYQRENAQGAVCSRCSNAAERVVSPRRLRWPDEEPFLSRSRSDRHTAGMDVRLIVSLHSNQ